MMPHNPLLLLAGIILSASGTDLPAQRSINKAALSIRGILLGRQDLCPQGYCDGTTICCAPTEGCWRLFSGSAHCCPIGRQGCFDGRCCDPGTICILNSITNVISCQASSAPLPPPDVTTIFGTTTSPPLPPPAKTTTIITITTPPPSQSICNCPPNTYCIRDPATNQPQCWSDITYTWTYYYYYWSVTWWYTTTIYLENLNRNSIVALTTPPPPASLTGSVPPAGLPTVIAITTPPPIQNACNCPPDTYCLGNPATNQPQCWSDITYTWTYYYYYWSVTWWYTTTIYLENFNRNSIVVLTTPPPPASLTSSVPPAGLPATSITAVSTPKVHPTETRTHADIIPTVSPPKASTERIVYPTEAPTLHPSTKPNNTYNYTYSGGPGISSSAVGVGYSLQVMFALLGTVFVWAVNGL